MDMSKVTVEAIWQPEVLGRMGLDERRFMYAVKAPSDMAANIPNLIGTMIVLDGVPFQIRGITPDMPARAITKDDVIAFLVRSL